jgi:serine/threonine protein kinase
VYLAHDTLTFDNPVVLKIYARTHGNSISNISEREARALCSVQHNAVVRCYFYGTDSEVGDVLVLEYVKGTTLRQLLNTASRMNSELIGPNGNPSVQIKFIEQIANALAECHSAGVVHKDLKPENILVEHSAGIWLPKIIDFGISSAPFTSEASLPTVGPYTIGYVAPERYDGVQRTASADVYSLGVIAYELLTGVSPFPVGDQLAVAKAQQGGAFLPLLEVRPKGLTARAADLIEKMMSVDPLARPNALTLTSSLPAALQAVDWQEFYKAGQRAYENGDSETAFGLFERAAFAAKESEHGSDDYVQVSRFLVDSARDCAKLFQISAQLVQPLLRSTVKNPGCAEVMEEFTELVITEPQARPEDKEAQRNTVATLVDLLSSHDPTPNLSGTVRRVLRHGQSPVVWDFREAVYELGLVYRAASYLVVGSLEKWCIHASRVLRERNATPDECQMWLRRAERLGVQGNVEYRSEAEAVAKLLRTTANARELPPLAKVSESSSRVVGEDERGHLQVDKIVRWVARARNRHPYIQEVWRVRKDPDLPLRPTRILELSNMSQHISAVKGVDPVRIVPAVLDESYCIPSGRTVLRINIVLPEGTTLRQREAAMERFRRDGALFGEDS